MPRYDRDRTTPVPNRPRLVGVPALIELDGELRLFPRDDFEVLPLWPAATPIRAASPAVDGTPVVA